MITPIKVMTRWLQETPRFQRFLPAALAGWRQKVVCAVQVGSSPDPPGCNCWQRERREAGVRGKQEGSKRTMLWAQRRGGMENGTKRVPQDGVFRRTLQLPGD